MEIKWGNLIAFAMLLAAIVIAVSMGDRIVAFLHSMTDIGPGHTDEEKTMGLIAFGLVGVLIVAVVRILVSGRGNGGGGSS